MSTKEVVMIKGICHSCGREADLFGCPFAEEIHDDYEEQCCADCSPECAMEV